MSDFPVKELIVQAVEAALKKITPPGYKTAGVQVVRPRRTGEKFAPQEKMIIVLQEPEQRSPDDDLVGNPAAIAWRLPITCDLVVRVSEADTTPMDQALNVFEADVRKALMQDEQFGRLAVRSELGGTEYPDAAAGVEGVTVSIDVIYRTAINDPYVNRA
ncbi:MAG TPA: hypothetical protein VNA25_13545 [Phycisphaerae bacterium]|nr:hypothetical protein [Phycisphaerae bacterium]